MRSKQRQPEEVGNTDFPAQFSEAPGRLVARYAQLFGNILFPKAPLD
jgi:hypothetical protein